MNSLVELLDLKAILITAMIFIPLERTLPLRPDQRTLRDKWTTDVVYLLLNHVLIKIGFLILVGSAMVGVRLVMPGELAGYVRAQPIWLQAIEVILIADLSFYLAHRAFHAVPFLWKFHAIHHSIEEMDWLAAHRVHPVDQILTMAASLLPVYAFGFSNPAIAIYTFVYQAQSLLIHSNTRIGFGPIKFVLASPQFHHWHHANERRAFDKNFAGQLPFLDALLGTLYIPNGIPKVYGCDDAIPPLYHQQLAYPVRSPVVPP